MDHAKSQSINENKNQIRDIGFDYAKTLPSNKTKIKANRKGEGYGYTYPTQNQRQCIYKKTQHGITIIQKPNL